MIYLSFVLSQEPKKYSLKRLINNNIDDNRKPNNSTDKSWSFKNKLYAVSSATEYS